MNKRTEIIKKVIFSLIPLLVLLIVMEFSLRAYYYIKLGGYEYSIQRCEELKLVGPYYEKENKIANELGFSGGGAFDPRKYRGEYRILTIGGSGCAGTRESSWPDIMKGELSKKVPDKKVTVVNAGIGGHTSSGEKKYLTKWIKLKPDLIIVYDGWNDMYFSRYLPEEYKDQFEIANSYYNPDLGERLSEFFLSQSILLRKIKVFGEELKDRMERDNDVKYEGNEGIDPEGVVTSITLNKPEADSEESPDGFEYIEGKPFKMKLNWRQGNKIKTVDLQEQIPDNLSDIYRANLEEMVMLAKGKNIDVMFVVQPDLLYHYTNNPEVFGEEDMETVIGYHEGCRKDWINTTALLYPKIYEIMFQVAENNSNVIGVYKIDDIFDGFSDKLEFWNLDSCHQTHEGREVIGKHIADLVYEEVFEKD